VTERVQKFIARQPIFDRDQNIFAYELLFRSGIEGFFRAESQDQATSSVMLDSFLLIGIKALTGGKLGFFNVTRNVLTKDLVTLLPREHAGIEILETFQPDTQVVAACKVLKDRGYVIALDDFVIRQKPNPLIPLADVIKIDVAATSPAMQRHMVDRFATNGTKMLAEKVETREQFASARAIGYDYFQGYFFSRPEIVATQDVPAFKLNYLRLLQAMNRPEPELAQIERIIKTESSLCYKLLRHLNSARFGVRQQIHSIQHALTLLGLEETRRWVSLVGLAGLGMDRPSELVSSSMTRARHCELLAAAAGLGARASDLFLTGLLSMMDAILDRPLERIVEGLPVSAEIRMSLLGRNHRYRYVLDLVRAYERGDWNRFSQIARALFIPEQAVADTYLAAVQWAAEIFKVEEPALA